MFNNNSPQPSLSQGYNPQKYYALWEKFNSYSVDLQEFILTKGFQAFEEQMKPQKNINRSLNFQPDQSPQMKLVAQPFYPHGHTPNMLSEFQYDDETSTNSTVQDING
jgi:hypothetical protein